jgi:hypothetical protein
MSYPNPNPNRNPNPMLGHNFIASDTISYRNLYQILSGGTLSNGTLLCLTLAQRISSSFH